MVEKPSLGWSAFDGLTIGSADILSIALGNHSLLTQVQEHEGYFLPVFLAEMLGLIVISAILVNFIGLAGVAAIPLWIVAKYYSVVVEANTREFRSPQ